MVYQEGSSFRSEDTNAICIAPRNRDINLAMGSPRLFRGSKVLVLRHLLLDLELILSITRLER